MITNIILILILLIILPVMIFVSLIAGKTDAGTAGVYFVLLAWAIKSGVFNG